MNNGNNPANPLTGEAYTNFASYDGDNQFTSYDPKCQGLTKREAFAMAAMQGICSSGPTISNEQIALEAVLMADALLAELEK